MDLKVNRSKNNQITILGGEEEVSIIGQGFVLESGNPIEVVVLKEDESGPEAKEKIFVDKINNDDVTDREFIVKISVVSKDVNVGYRKIIVKDTTEELDEGKRCKDKSKVCDDLEKGIEIVK